MAVYASVEQCRDYVQDNRPAKRALPGDDEAVERLLCRAERAVDLALGSAFPRDDLTGLRLDPSSLTQAQRDALARAACAWVEWVLLIGSPVEAGDSVETPNGVFVAQPAAASSPKMLAELAGFDLVKRRLAALPDPPPVIEEYAPCAP